MYQQKKKKVVVCCYSLVFGVNVQQSVTCTFKRIPGVIMHHVFFYSYRLLIIQIMSPWFSSFN